MSITGNYQKLRKEIPDHVTIVLAGKTKSVEELKEDINLPHVDMKYLSMGMSNSYMVAIEEGSNMVRLGTVVFGKREYH